MSGKLARIALVALALLVSGTAIAGRQPQEFRESTKMTDEEIAAAKLRGRTRLPAYGETLEAPPKPFPWMFVGLIALALITAFPFAVRSYRDMANELKRDETPPRARDDTDA